MLNGSMSCCWTVRIPRPSKVPCPEYHSFLNDRSPSSIIAVQGSATWVVPRSGGLYIHPQHKRIVSVNHVFQFRDCVVEKLVSGVTIISNRRGPENTRSPPGGYVVR